MLRDAATGRFAKPSTSAQSELAECIRAGSLGNAQIGELIDEAIRIQPRLETPWDNWPMIIDAAARASGITPAQQSRLEQGQIQWRFKLPKGIRDGDDVRVDVESRSRSATTVRFRLRGQFLRIQFDDLKVDSNLVAMPASASYRLWDSQELPDGCAENRWVPTEVDQLVTIHTRPGHHVLRGAVSIHWLSSPYAPGTDLPPDSQVTFETPFEVVGR
jgi:hypothetical protein